MKKITAFTLFLAISILSNLYAQDSELLIGKWQFEQVESSTANEKKVAMFRGMVKNTRMEFKKDGSYVVNMMGNKDEGDWKLDGLTLSLKPKKGKDSKLNLTELTNENLIFVLGPKGDLFVKLTRVKKFKSPEKKKVEKRENVAITAEQLKGKWYFKDKEMSGNDEDAIGEMLLIGMLKESYAIYHSDGSYEDNALYKTIVEGTWELEKNNTVLIITKKDKSISYDIVKISDDELGIINEKIDGVITFVRLKPEEE